MRKVRVYVDAPLAAGANIPLPPFSAEHLTRVLRLPDGAEVVCFNGDGSDYAATLEVRTRGVAAVRVRHGADAAPESPLAITLAQCIARGEKMDAILQKATELGVARIVPLTSERTEVHLDEERAERRLVHWQRVVQSACEQSGRARVPEIGAPQRLADYAAEAGAEPAVKIALHPEAGHGLRALEANGAVVIAVGPEGGFSERDLDALASAGFERRSLGPRVLRTETAGPAAIAALQALYGDLG
jgi:16S rRNA (uracil1498-N3)-methyltransferase